MADLFGASEANVRDRIGTLRQVLGVDRFVEDEGGARGTRRIRLVNGGGLELDVHPDRALDLGQLTVDGVPVAWMSPTGIGSPHDFEASGTGWLRSFGGGLMATCGLDTFGPPSEDAGESFGLHGRIGTRPATVLRAEATPQGVVVEGEVRQAAVFGENMVLRRRISSAAGSTAIHVRDTVTNEGFDEAPHMILYHCNLGWPLLDDTATVQVNAAEPQPRDEAARRGVEAWSRSGPPEAGYAEQVFRHTFASEGPASAKVVNVSRGLSLEIAVSGATLPYLYQWKMLGRGHYVVGLEPSNCGSVMGRAAARASGDLPVLRAGESVTYDVSFTVRSSQRTAS